MRRYIQQLCVRLFRKLAPKPDHERENKFLRQALDNLVSENLDAIAQREAMERIAELIEARRMAGNGPWSTSEQLLDETDRLIGVAASKVYGNKSGIPLRETTPITAQGAYGDIELALQNVEWRREVNMSWLEFSRWGIQQIILISRLYYIKNPMIQRGVNVAAQYVFGRGVEVTSPDETANKVLQDFFERNASTLGQIALTDLERRKYYDGNLFFIFFPDKVSKGEVNIRTIDAPEIAEIVCDPEDVDRPRYYKRVWTERGFDEVTGITKTETKTLWYPAIGFEPTPKPAKIGTFDVQWDSPIHHRKCGAVAKWTFGCPLVYAALDWAKQSVRFLAHCATVKQSLAQISIIMSTKGGQQALQGLKGQLQTTVQTGANAWDTNPPAVDASIMATGPGTKIEAFNTKGAGGDPEEVRQFKLMVCMVFGLPETFFADVQTGNLATATSLDRPTELNFLEKQEAWREDLIIICKYVLGISALAPSGKIREAFGGKIAEAAMSNEKLNIEIREAGRVWEGPRGRWIMRAAKTPKQGTIEILVNFPAIVEGDVPALVTATVAAIATGKLDDNVAAKQLYTLLPDVKDGNAIADEQYPGTVTDRQKKKDDAAAALAAAPTAPFGKAKEAIGLARKLIAAVTEQDHEHTHTR